MIHRSPNNYIKNKVIYLVELSLMLGSVPKTGKGSVLTGDPGPHFI